MRRVSVMFAILLACLCYVPQPVAAATLTFPSATITSPDPFDVDIQIQDIASFYSFFFNLLYNPAVVELVDVTEGAFLRDTTIPPTTPPNLTLFNFDASVPGTIGIFNTLVGAPAGVSGTGSLAIVTFRPLMNGSAGLTFQDLDFAGLAPPVPCDDIEDDCPVDIFPIEVGANPGQVAIRQTAPVPEPATIALLGLGLIGVRRRFR